MNLPIHPVTWMLIFSLLLFYVMGHDKRQAQKEARRVSEATLWALAILGGALGGYMGMIQFRHKTKHWKFKLGFPALAILQLIIVGWLARPTL